ncbi:hypothetical protein J7E81_29785 [Bacillus sp. ISL-18]|uniref:hypothetical protein n=1 Tax=Bacillus sp. ISL-18 TaxID=2819118 RepID=UPI001BE5F921|nr:hypothetical protein [Bacillus sp. ISL-18]MBT2659322.1 hypothetical protein [Bacillus sp. ISL-18]
MFNEFEVYQMIKIRQEEIEKKARNAWKYGDLQTETFIQKVAEKSSIMQTNRCCACGC